MKNDLMTGLFLGVLAMILMLWIGFGIDLVRKGAKAAPAAAAEERPACVCRCRGGYRPGGLPKGSLGPTGAPPAAGR